MGHAGLAAPRLSSPNRPWRYFPGAGVAASFAAAMQERAHLKGQVVGTTLCGGNVDASVFAQVMS